MIMVKRCKIYNRSNLFFTDFERSMSIVAASLLLLFMHAAVIAIF